MIKFLENIKKKRIINNIDKNIKKLGVPLFIKIYLDSKKHYTYDDTGLTEVQEKLDNYISNLFSDTFFKVINESNDELVIQRYVLLLKDSRDEEEYDIIRFILLYENLDDTIKNIFINNLNKVYKDDKKYKKILIETII